MRKFLKSTWLIMTLLALFIAVSCKKAEEKVGDTKEIVLITMDSLDEHWLAVKAGAERKANEAGNVKVIFRAPAGKTDPNEQTRMVEDAINQKAAAIILAPTDPAALSQVADKAKAANIPLILIDSPLDTDSYTSFLSTDNKAAGALAADTLVDLIGKEGKIAIVHPQAAGSVLARGQGFEERIKQIAPNIKIVSVQYSDGDKARALNIATDLLTANPDLKAFFTSNEGTTVGVARALEDKELQDKVVLVGFDKSEDTVRALENKTLKATMVQNPDAMGYKGVEFVLEILDGKTPPKKVDTGVTVVTLENINLIKK